VPLERLAAGVCLLLFAASVPAALYKWVDEKGRVQYSDKPPTEKDKNAVEMTNRGIVVKKLETGTNAEQKKAKEEDLARKRAEEAKAAEQRRHDNALLLSYSNAQEIDLKRDREVQSLDTIIANLREQERSAREQLAADQRRLDFYARRKQAAPDTAKEDVRRSEAQLKVLHDEIERRQQEIGATRVKYDAIRKRYLELREEQAAAAPSAVADPTPTAKK